jgi:hypothetical protein
VLVDEVSQRCLMASRLLKDLHAGWLSEQGCRCPGGALAPPERHLNQVVVAA